jgi:ribosomal-protein-alanine N-acetyltransferase
VKLASRLKEPDNVQDVFELRKFTMNDLASVAHLNQICLPENYTDFFFVDLYRRFPETFVVAEGGKEIVGYIMCRIEVGLSNIGLPGLVKKGHVVSVAVMPEHRHKGVGKALVTRAMEGMRMYGAKQCYLEVRVSNEEAVGLYKKLGLEVTRTVHGYYADGEDAYVMSTKL